MYAFPSRFVLAIAIGISACWIETGHTLEKDSLKAPDVDVCTVRECPGDTGSTAPPNAHFIWSMPSRYDASWSSYDEGTHAYDPDFISATQFTVELDACLANSPYFDYQWEITRVRDNQLVFARTGGCHQLPLLEPGLHHVKLIVTSKTSGEKASRTKMIEPIDWLIVSIGDSAASGQGNPPFVDDQCHRSKISGHALAAQQLEEASPFTSVTFVSVACSGAKVADLMTRGQHPGLARQIDEVRDVIGNRYIDALFLSIGINDLSFAALLKDCVLSPLDTCIEPIMARSAMLREFMPKLTALEDSIHSALDIDEIYITEYPIELFRDGVENDTCGVFVNISDPEAESLHRIGRALNRIIKEHAQDYEWNYISGIVEAFDGHGYCEGDPDEDGNGRYYVLLNESLQDQSDIKGAVHPNRFGHQVIADLLAASVYFGPIPDPLKNVIVSLKAVRILDDYIPAGPEVDVWLAVSPHDDSVVIESRNVWQLLPSSFTYMIPMYEAGILPRLATQLMLSARADLEAVPGELPPKYVDDFESEYEQFDARSLRINLLKTAAQNYGATSGTATLSSAQVGQAQLQVRYTVSVISLTGPAPVPGPIASRLR